MKRHVGYVATLDVLGFADLLYRDGYSQQLKLYMDTVNEVIRPAHVKVECVVFSDSIVLTASGDTDKAFLGLIKACSAAFHELVMCEMPVRGAVAFGRYWRETSAGSVFLAGRPIVEAYRLERAEKWVGIALCPSVLHKQDNLVMGTYLPTDTDEVSSEHDLALRLQPASVPFQEPGSASIGTLNAYAIVPLDADDDIRTVNRTVHRMCGYLENLRLKAPGPTAQAKYTATLMWLQEVEKRFESARLGRKALKGKTSRPTMR